MKRFALPLATTACAILAVRCAAQVVGFDNTPNDAGAQDATSDADAQALDPFDGSVDAASTAFFIFATQTYAAPGGDLPDAWGGVLRYDVTGTAGTATPGPAISRSAVADPFSLAFRQTTAEVFVGNRHGCLSGDGIPGSISRFLYNAKTGTLTANGSILDTDGDMQVVFDPTETELYAAHCNLGISKFAFDSNGNAKPDGTLAPSLNFPRGLAVSPDGKRLYVSTADYTVHELDIVTGNELASIDVMDTGAQLHEMFIVPILGPDGGASGADLFVGDITKNNVYHFKVSSSDDLTFVETIPADNPISVAFSPDGKELYATASRLTNVPSVIDRFLRDDAGVWQKWAQISIKGSSLGGTLVFRQDAVPTPPK